MKRIEDGIIGEGMVGKNVRTFVSVVEGHVYFGFKEVEAGRILEVEEVENIKKAMDKVIEHAKAFSKTE